MTNNLNRMLIILALLVGIPFYLLLLDNAPGQTQAKPLDIAQLRHLAASRPGPAPMWVEAEIVASRNLIGNLVAAGSGLKLEKMAITAWRLPVAGPMANLSAIHIDAGISATDAAALNMRHYDPQAQARVARALARSSLIVTTQARAWGAAALPGLLAHTPAAQRPAFLAKLRLAPGQWPAHSRAPFSPAQLLSGQVPQAVAPGVVVVPTGVAPGSQMVFVRLANGREYLFTGDIAPLAANWTQLRVHSRYLARHFGDESRNEAKSWLLTIRQLAKAAPGLVVVPGHDFGWLHNAAKRQHIRLGFSQALPR